MVGAIKPSSGSISIFGESPSAHRTRIRTGTLLQNSGIPPTLKVNEHIRSFQSYYPNAMGLGEAIERSGLQSLENRQSGTLSTGQLQRLGFALAICGNPDLLFLDEPTTALDIEARRNMWTEISKLSDSGRTILLATHNLEEAERLADRIMILHHGQLIVDSSPKQIKALIGSKEISARTSMDPEKLNQLPAIKRIEHTDDYVQIFTNEAEVILKYLFQFAESVKDLEVKPASLEDAYLHMVKESD